MNIKNFFKKQNNTIENNMTLELSGEGISYKENSSKNNCKRNKFEEKSIRFLDKGSHYELHFNDTFDSIDGERPLYTDLILDLKEANKDKEIHVFINSLGGNLTTLLLLISQIKEFRYVVTIGTGEICSAGFLLWSQGDERYLYEITECMYHDLSTGIFFNKRTDISKRAEHLEKYSSIIENYVSNILTKEEIELGRTSEVWFVGSELIERGVASDIKNYYTREPQSSGLISAVGIGDDLYFFDVETNMYVKIIITKEEKTKDELKQMCVLLNTKVEEKKQVINPKKHVNKKNNEKHKSSSKKKQKNKTVISD